MSTFLFVSVPSTGHVDPTLPVAAELVRRGHEVVYFLTDAYRTQIEATGAVYREYPGIKPDYFDEVASRFNPVQLAVQLVETAIWLVPLLVDAIKQVQPQVIFYDSMCPWGRIIARQLGLPAVTSMALMDLPPRYMLKSGELKSAMEVIARGLPWLPRYQQASHRLKQASGVSIPSFYRVLNWPGDLNICYTAPVMYPDVRNFGPNYKFVGPPMPAEAQQPWFPFDLLDTGRPLVYISLGTVFNNSPQFFRTCLAALAHSEVQVILSTGRRLKADDLQPLPTNAIVRDYVPQQAILQRARLFISHSGANSVHHALYHGVPLLMVPQQFEQAIIATRVAELGAGLRLNRRSVTLERVSSMANQILADDSFGSRATALGSALKETGGALQAANELENAVW